MTIDRIPYHPAHPDPFFDHLVADESPDLTRQLLYLEATRNEFVGYTNRQSLQLLGIFPCNSQEAYFGYWETPNDPVLTAQAFALLEADARLRGRTGLVGPLNVNTFHRYRLRLEPAPSWGNFDREPTNPAYYPALLAQAGFRVNALFESRLLRKADVPAVYLNKQPLLDSLASLPFTFLPLNSDTWPQHEADLFDLVHRVFGANPAYRPISPAQFQLLYNRQFAEKLCPFSSSLARDNASGRLVGLCFCLPDYGGLTLPPGVSPTFARDFDRLDRKVLLVKTVGVDPAFRKQGLMSALGGYAMLSFQSRYDDVIFCLMRQDNFSTHFSNGFPVEVATYALYEKPLPPVP